MDRLIIYLKMLMEKEKGLVDFLKAKIDAAIAGKNPFFKPLG